MSWMTEMEATPPFQNSGDFELQFRRTIISIEAKELADEIHGSQPKDCDDREAWGDRWNVDYHAIIKRLWTEKYGGKV